MASVIKFSKDLNKLYSSIDNAIASKSDIYKPIIGISAGIDDEKNGIGRSYVKSVLNAGGIPVILPVTDEPTAIQGILDKLDGIIMSGGGDIHPALFGEEPLPGLGNVSIERDISDLILLYLAVKKNIPVLGICRGIQLINVAFGGTLYQDLPSEYIKKLIMHNQTMPRDVKCHTIAIDSKSHLFDILKTENLAVNSFHHQSIKILADGFDVVAQSSDGVIEAIEGFPKYNILAVQFHPEDMAAEKSNVLFINIFADLVVRARNYKEKI